jgi:hypothetical protein
LNTSAIQAALLSQSIVNNQSFISPQKSIGVCCLEEDLMKEMTLEDIGGGEDTMFQDFS